MYSVTESTYLTGRGFGVAFGKADPFCYCLTKEDADRLVAILNGMSNIVLETARKVANAASLPLPQGD